MLYLVCYCGAECHVTIHNLHSTLFSQALASASDVRTEQFCHPVPSIDDIKAKPPTLSLEVSPHQRFGSHCKVFDSQLRCHAGKGCVLIFRIKSRRAICSLPPQQLAQTLVQRSLQHQLLQRTQLKALS